MIDLPKNFQRPMPLSRAAMRQKQAVEKDFEAIYAFRRAYAEFRTWLSSKKSFTGYCENLKSRELPTVAVNGNYRCVDNGSAFAISAQFATGTFYCIDSAGFEDKVTGLHSGTTCK